MPERSSRHATAAKPDEELSPTAATANQPSFVLASSPITLSPEAATAALTPTDDLHV